MDCEYRFWEIWRDPYLLSFIFSFNHGTNGDIAAKIGYLHGIVYSTNLTFTENAMDLASQYGNLDVVKWLHKNREEGCTTNAMDCAADKGHLDVVKWLHENRKEGCSIWAMNWAARNGHLDVVKWLHKNREEGCTDDAMDDAAASGHLDVCKWLHKNRNEGCKAWAMTFAAEAGHLSIVQWLFEYTKPSKKCIKDARHHALFWKHSDVAEWLKAQL